MVNLTLKMITPILRSEATTVEIKKEAEHKEVEAKSNFHRHEVFARGVTMFQVAIAIAAISALTKRRRYWIGSMILGSIGCVFLVLGWIAH